MQRIAILGSTGSIGQQTLDVVERNPKLFKVVALSAHNNFDLLYNQALKFLPDYVAFSKYIPDDNQIKMLEKTGAKLITGEDCLEKICEIKQIDSVIYATVGFSCLKAVLKGIREKKRICLANKETLVTAGEIVMKQARENGVQIFPVDSEHSAIWQCLMGNEEKAVDKLIITASGGAFRDYKKSDLENVTASDALKHPNWNMGNKITIDSATMMNKAFEVIEAHHLFGIPIEKIQCVIHKQSIIHSMVEFCDGAVISQMGIPSMEIPIALSLTYPERISNNLTKLNFDKISELSFKKLDRNDFPCFDLCLKAFEKGGLYTTIINAFNDVLVEEFLNDRIKFLDIPKLMEIGLNKVDGYETVSVENIINKNIESREFMYKFLKKTYN